MRKYTAIVLSTLLTIGLLVPFQTVSANISASINTSYVGSGSATQAYVSNGNTIIVNMASAGGGAYYTAGFISDHCLTISVVSISGLTEYPGHSVYATHSTLSCPLSDVLLPGYVSPGVSAQIIAY